MTDNKCSFCDKFFSSKYGLQKHIKSAKFCLEIQEKNLKTDRDSFTCQFCCKEYYRKDCLQSHLNYCKEKDIKQLKNELEKLNNLIEKVTKIKDKLQKENNELIIYKTLYEEEKLKFNKLESKYECLENDLKHTYENNSLNLQTITTKAIENAGNKTVTNNNVTNRNNIQNIINNLTPLTKDYMEEQKQFVTIEHVRHGTESIAKFAKDYSFKDRIAITDASRFKFVFKDEDGTTIYDPHGVKLTYKFIQVNKDVLINALDEYLNKLNLKLLDACDEQNIDVIGDLQKEMCSLLMIQRLLKEGETGNNIKHYNKFKDDFVKYLTRMLDAVNNNEI